MAKSKANGIYHGHLVCDGNGNLLADEGPHKGHPVAYHEGSFVFVQKGEPSHNERHHQNTLDMTPTQHLDSSMPGYAGTQEEPTEGNEHHWMVTDGTTSQTPDAVSETATGHTDAWKDDEGSDDE